MNKFYEIWKVLMILLISSSVLIVQAQKNVTSEKAPTKNAEQIKELNKSPEEQIKLLDQKGLKGEEFSKAALSSFDETQLKVLAENGITIDVIMTDENALYKAIEYLNVPDNDLISPFFKPGDTDAVATYTFSQSTGTYTEITSGTVLGSTTSDDQRFVDPAVPAGGSTTTGPGFPIGFNFTFDGVVFDRLAINNNGWISLGQSALTPAVNNSSTSAYTPIGSVIAITPDNLVSRIVGLGRDLQGQTGSELRIQTIGTTPNQECVIQWKGYRKYNATGDNFNFQIRLLENGNVIQLVYGTMTNNATSTTVQVGLRAAPAATATNFANRSTTTDWSATSAGGTNLASCTLSNTVYPASGLTFIYTPPLVGTPFPPTNPNPADGATGVAITGNLTWTFGANTATYDLKYGPSGNMTQVITNAAAGTTGSYTYTANYSTSYQWQVIEHNGALQTDGPVWSFSTVCDLYTLPINQGFNDAAIPLCWQDQLVADPGTDPVLSYEASITSPARTPYEGARFVKFNSFSCTAGAERRLVSPGFSTTGLSNVTVQFAWSEDPGYPTYLLEGVTLQWSADGANWNTPAGSFYQRVNPVDGWYNKTFTFPGDVLNLPTVYIGFLFHSQYGNNCALDDVSIIELLCPAPGGLTTTEHTQTSAKANWTDANAANKYDIVWGLDNVIDPDNPATYVGSVFGKTFTGPPYFHVMSSLNGSTNYEWYVRSDCGTKALSQWSGPAQFATLPGPHSLPLCENFESGFTYFGNAGGNNVDWTINTSYFHAGAQCAHNAYSISQTNILHETGILDLSSVPAALLEFWHIAKAEGDYDHCYVEISTDGGVTYTTLPTAAYSGYWNL